jgi:hypothetical protein
LHLISSRRHTNTWHVAILSSRNEKFTVFKSKFESAITGSTAPHDEWIMKFVPPYIWIFSIYWHKYSNWFTVYLFIFRPTETSYTYAQFQKTGKLTAPATVIPRFRKYNVDDYHFLTVLGKGSFGKVCLRNIPVQNGLFLWPF